MTPLGALFRGAKPNVLGDMLAVWRNLYSTLNYYLDPSLQKPRRGGASRGV